ncbi:MAG: ankyrin repeat domain-containing protein, partial [Saprospiraceae bacterium]|nr:ankyrin repeat domain-containing protein [Saprospiraceae bacterium]
MLKKNILSKKIIDLIVESNIVKLNEEIIIDRTILSKINKDGQNALIISMIYEKYDVSIFLINNFKIDMDIRDKLGWSALHYAVAKRNVLLINKLIERNADIEVKDNYGNTPLWRATFESKGFGEI